MNCCAMATSLNPTFVEQNWWENRCIKFNMVGYSEFL